MNPVLDDILSCPNLPSLPAVAMRIIELTSDVNVSLKELARTIEHDQGLAAKILKTVNSSFYGLRQRCSTIDKALVMLGLSPVKSLALGFSLVQCLDDPSERDFDFISYWRRGLYTAVAGKLIAEKAGFGFGDEVFLGGLLQDVGMVAMHRSLGGAYGEVLAATRGDHRTLVRCELQRLDLQHPDVGAMLVERWRLPEQLVMAVKYHERPSAAPSTCIDHVRCVGLGNLVHDILTGTDAEASYRRLYERGASWYKLTTSAVDEALARSHAASREIAGLFNLDIGAYFDPTELLTEASRRTVALVRESPSESSVLAGAQASVLAGAEFDPLTGVVGRTGFEAVIREGFSLARENDEALALVQVVIDGFESLTARFGDSADVEAVMGVTALLKRAFEGEGGVVCRVAPAAFAVVLPGTGRRAASGLAEGFVRDLAACSGQWLTQPAAAAAGPLTATIGISSLEPDTAHIFTEPGKLVVACARAVQAARGAGGAAVRIFTPHAAAA